MADHKKSDLPSVLFRGRSIDEADRLFGEALAIACRAEHDEGIAFRWSEAASLYEQSASLFQKADLGLMARDIYGHASYCFGKAGASDDARRCMALSEAIPAYWERFR